MAGLLKNAGLMSVAVLISRVLGLVRESVFATLFGAGYAADAYQIAFRIPNLFRDLFAEGALSSAFVAVFARGNDLERKRVLARRVMTASTLVVGVICLLFLVAPELFVAGLADAFREVPGKFELTARLTRVLSPFLLFISCAALAMGVLNSLGSFFIPSLGAASFNLGNVLVGGGLALALAPKGLEASILGFTIGTLCGSLFQWATQWRELRRKGFSPWAGLRGVVSPRAITEAFRDPGVREVGFIMAPSVLAVAAVQVNVFVSSSFATELGQGPVSWLAYAYRIMHFPMGVFGVAMSTATLPRLAKLLSEGKRDEFHGTLAESLRWTLLLAIGSCAGLVVFGEPVASLLYERGRFGANDTARTAEALMPYAFGLIAFNTTKIFAQAFYALRKVWIPSIVSLVTIGLHWGLCWRFSREFGHAGLAAATSVVGFVNTFVLAIILKRQGVVFEGKRLALTIAAAVAGGVFIGIFAYFGVPAWLLQLRHERGQSLFAVATLVAVAVAGGGYLCIVALLSREGRAFAKKLTGRFRRGSKKG